MAPLLFFIDRVPGIRVTQPAHQFDHVHSIPGLKPNGVSVGGVGSVTVMVHFSASRLQAVNGKLSHLHGHASR